MTDSDAARPESRLPFPVVAIATGLYSGYIPWASGTFGSLVGLLLYCIPGFEHPAVLTAMILIGFFAGVYTSARVAAVVGNRLTGSASFAKEKFQSASDHPADPSIVVIDEIVGMWISLLWLPKTLPAMALAFVLFRVMDILKPEPARSLERLPGGWGIMLDDIAAGIYALLAAHALIFAWTRILPSITIF